VLTHAPADYACPFCLVQRGVHDENNQPADIVAVTDCEGISTRQHNEPAGHQDVWHLHVHVFPRSTDDRLYEQHRSTRWVTPDERLPYADRLAAAIGAPRTFA
jgi:hypothetical protein